MEWRKFSLCVGAINCVCDIRLFCSNFLILSILFEDRDLTTYVFCFAGPPSIDMAKSIYELGFDIPFEGREGGGLL